MPSPPEPGQSEPLRALSGIACTLGGMSTTAREWRPPALSFNSWAPAQKHPCAKLSTKWLGNIHQTNRVRFVSCHSRDAQIPQHFQICLHGKAVSFTPSSASPLASYCEASFPGYGFSTSRPPVRIWFDHRLPPSGSTCCWRLLPQWKPVASPMTPTNLTTLTRSGQDGRKGGIGFSGIAAPFRGACIPSHRLDGMHILCARSAGCFPYPAPA